jgi:hypothetical protein
MRRRVRRATTPVTTMILILSLEDLAEEYLTTRGRRGMAGLGSWRIAEDSTQVRSSQSTLFKVGQSNE